MFLCLYPIERRTAALARNMKVRRIPKVCEFAEIRGTAGSGISPLCPGAIQGAHIKPDALGGSDRPENGLWLCEFHHRETEGKIKGSRTDRAIDVQYTKKI